MIFKSICLSLRYLYHDDVLCIKLKKTFKNLSSQIVLAIAPFEKLYKIVKNASFLATHIRADVGYKF